MITRDLECPWHDYCIICKLWRHARWFRKFTVLFRPIRKELESSMYNNKRNLCQDLLTIENTDSDLKVHALQYANELFVRVRLSFQILLQNRSTYSLGKEYWRVLVVDKSTDHDKTYFDFHVFVFYDNINVKENVFFQSASWKRHCATHWRERRGWDLVIFYWFVLSMRMQVILDFRLPGFSPYMGRRERRVQGLD